MIIECELEENKLNPLRQPSEAYPKHATFIKLLKKEGIISQDGKSTLMPFHMSMGVGRYCYWCQIVYEPSEEKEENDRLAQRRKEANEKYYLREEKFRREREQRAADKVAQDRQREKMEEEYAVVMEMRRRDLFNTMMLTIEKAYQSEYHVSERRDKLCYCEGDSWNLQQQQAEYAVTDLNDFPSRCLGLTRGRSEVVAR